jgi:hypothetical protein
VDHFVRKEEQFNFEYAEFETLLDSQVEMSHVPGKSQEHMFQYG